MRVELLAEQIIQLLLQKKGNTKMDIVLWIVQGLLALAFLMAGFMKTFIPISTLQKRMTWVSSVAAPFVRFIGVAELLGAVGLILPQATGISSPINGGRCCGISDCHALCRCL